MKFADKGWVQCSLEKLTSLIKDGSHGTHKDVDDGIPFLSAKDIRDGFLEIPGDCRQISRGDYASIHKSYEIEPNDILLTIVGSIGRCYLMRGSEPHFSIQRSVAVIRPDGVNPGYLYQYLRSNQFQANLKEFTNASAQGGVYLGSLGKCTINLPTIPSEQTKIAEILSTVDRAIDQTEELIAKQQRIKTGLMQDLLTRGIDEQGNLRSEHTHIFKDSPLGRIPIDWNVSPANSLCLSVIDCKNRTPPESKDGHPVIRTPNVRAGKFIFEDLVYTDQRSYEVWTARGKPRAGDVVITREAPFGEACIIPEEAGEPCLGQRMMMYRPDQKKIRNDFLLYAIYSEEVQKRLLELAGGSTVGHIRVGDIRNLAIPYPLSLKEQERIAHILNGITNVLGQHTKELTKLRGLKTAFMQDLLTGKKRVTPLLNDPEVVS